MSIIFICNQSLEESLFPNMWNNAKVSPLHKCGPCDDVNNYRPICGLPTLSKILEKKNILINYLNEYNLLCPNHSGFGSAYSYETALVNMTD